MNKLYKTLIYDKQVSLSVLETTDLVRDAIKIHGLGDGSAVLLGGMLTAAAYMAGCLKSERGAISLTVKSGEWDTTASVSDDGSETVSVSNDGSATVSVSGDAQGHIRGYIDGGENGLKGGTLTVIKDDGFFRPFVGACELKCDDVSENLMQYFHISEQIPTAVAIGVNVKNGKLLAAGGVVMQLLPGTSEENMQKAEDAMQNFVRVADVVEELGAEGIMNKFFSGRLNAAGTSLTFPEYKCNCSRKKIEGVILPLGEEELLNTVKEQGCVNVHCHYCNTDYRFTKDDVLKLFGK